MSQVERVNQDFSTIGTIEEKLSPMDAVRAYCTQCLGMTRWNEKEVEDCQGDQAACGPCPFYPYRLGKRPTMKTFRKLCLDCTQGDREYVRECPATFCPCYPYRMGSNPALIGIGRKPSEKSLEALKRFHEQRRHDIKNEPQSTNPLQDNPTPLSEVINMQKRTFIDATEGRA